MQINILISLIKSKFREPLELFWNLFFPLLFLILAKKSYLKSGISATSFMDQVGTFIAWALSMSAIYGVGMLIVFWREMGFLKTFIQAKDARSKISWLLIIYQILATIIVSTIMIVGANYVFSVGLGVNIFKLVLLLSLGTTLVSWMSLFLASLPIGARNLGNFLTVMTIFFVWITPQFSETSIIKVVNHINPIYYVKYWSNFIEQPELLYDINFLISTLCFFLLGLVGLIKFKSNPTEGR